jgi:hypothetical protein
LRARLAGEVLDELPDDADMEDEEEDQATRTVDDGNRKGKKIKKDNDRENIGQEESVYHNKIKAVTPAIGVLSAIPAAVSSSSQLDHIDAVPAVVDYSKSFILRTDRKAVVEVLPEKSVKITVLFELTGSRRYHHVLHFQTGC